MRIYRCVKTNLLTQGYGVKNTQASLIPLYNSLGLAGHEGYDLAVVCKNNQVKHGGQCEQVYFDLDIKATITTIQKDENYGYGIVARSEDKDGIFDHIWWHFDVISPNLTVGTVLETGDVLGTAGNTGRSTGAHLHRELRPFGRDNKGNYYKLQPNNGYKNAIDLAPYFDDRFVLDVLSNLKEQVSILQRLINLFKSR